MASALKKIFLVDDDHNNNEMLKMHLSSKFKLEILTFSTGESNLKGLLRGRWTGQGGTCGDPAGGPGSRGGSPPHGHGPRTHRAGPAGRAGRTGAGAHGARVLRAARG